MTEEQKTVTKWCRCGHMLEAHTSDWGCLPRIGVTCNCKEFVETRSNMQEAKS